jgi:hypothetical protein
MTDVAIGEAPPELAPPVLPAPEAIAEVETAAPQAAAADGLAPATDESAPAPTEFAPAVDEASSEVPSADTRAALEIEHPIGPVRQGVLDHLIDSEGPQTVAQIIAGLGNYSRGTVEAAVLRELRSGRIERVAPGTYRLARAKPAEAKPAPQPEPDKPEDEWFAALDGWINDPETWDREKLGPRPNEPGRQIPADIVARGVDRSRKRKERRREAEAAAAKRTAADAELRDRLIAATGGNIVRTSALDDVGPIKLALQVVPIDRILSAIRYQTDRKLYPKNEPARSWGEPRLLKAIAENYCAAVIVPSMVEAWSKAARAPAPTARSSSPPAGDMPDDNIDRSHHDVEHAPPGPHSLSKSPMDGDADAVPAVVPDVPANAADASEAPTAVSVPPV